MCALFSMIAAVAIAAAADTRQDYFTISVVDEQTGLGVPLVELRTVDASRYWTDSQGLVAFREPDMMNQSVFFHVRSHGYEFPADGFGYRGKALDTVPGGLAELKLRRINIAQRLYRVTGAGIYRDSVLLGRKPPIDAPLLNAQVVGSDSVNTAVYRGKLYWFWGDTNRAAYPLGTFHVPGAVSKLPGQGGLDPALGVNLEYFTRDDGFAASLCEMPGEGPTWIDGLCVIRDPQRGERMFARYVKVRKFLDVYERGLVEFNDRRQRFGHVTKFDFEAPLYPHGHALWHKVGGQDFVYFGNPYPLSRVAAQAAALADPRQYEGFTCLSPLSTARQPRIDRDAQGAIRYGWKRNTPPPTPKEQARWLSAGLLKENEAILALRDFESGKPLVAHAGSVAWNEFRRRFVMIAEQSGGSSNLGEIWYAEADTLTGPWIYARKVATHDKYSFYNPKHHAMLDQQGGRRIFFEGTYSTFFSGNDDPTPRYDYNQIMYELDLNDPRLVLPVAAYQRDLSDVTSIGTGDAYRPGAAVAFMALDRAIEGAVAVARRMTESGAVELSVSAGAKAPHTDVAFYALSADAPTTVTTIALYRWKHSNGDTRYAVEGAPAPEGFQRADHPLCRVWRYPLAALPRWE